MKPQSNQSNSKLEESLRATLRSASSITRRRFLGDFEQSCTYNMNDYYERLKCMVPYMPMGRRLTKVEILQYVIDYIQDLQGALETQSSIRHSSPSTRSNRSPLSTISLNKKPDKV